jgi:surface-anchored protein
MKTPTLILTGLLAAGFAAYAGKVTLSTGHTDVAVVYDNGEFIMNVSYDETETSYDAKDVILLVNNGAATTVPNDPLYSFLGPVGSPVWILPQVQDAGLLFLGFGSDDLPTGVFQNDTVHIRLTKVKGPGEFAMFANDPFGTPIVIANSRDGLDAADTYAFVAGSDAHFNWAFSKAGEYHVSFETTGTLLDGTVISTGEVTYKFHVVRLPHRGKNSIHPGSHLKSIERELMRE